MPAKMRARIFLFFVSKLSLHLIQLKKPYKYSLVTILPVAVRVHMCVGGIDGGVGNILFSILFNFATSK